MLKKVLVALLSLLAFSCHPLPAGADYVLREGPNSIVLATTPCSNSRVLRAIATNGLQAGADPKAVNAVMAAMKSGKAIMDGAVIDACWMAFQGEILLITEGGAVLSFDPAAFKNEQQVDSK